MHYQPPHQPPPRRRFVDRKGFKFGCLPAIIITWVIFLASLFTGGDDTDDKPDAKPPAYTVVKQDSDGNQRDVVVDVDSTKQLRSVFETVIKDLDDEAGYYVQINCSTGGTDSVDNRLANGRYAVGRMGAAVTGMSEGNTEFSTNKDRTCPAKG